MFSDVTSPYPAVPTETWEFLVEDGFVVVRPDTPCLFFLNATAKVIWDAFRDTGSTERAADTLVEIFDIPRAMAAKDVSAALNRWVDAGLLGSAPSATPPRWDGRHGEARAVAYCLIEGTTFLLVTDSAELTAELSPRLESIRVGACTPDVTIAIWGSADDFFAIVVGEECIAMEQGVRATRAVLFQEMARRARPGREWLALLHAGACGVNGRCVLFPASSYSGKSTLAAALMASGFALYSDDFVGLEAGSLQIPAMPFAIAIRQGSWDILRTWIPAIDACSATERFGEQVKFLPLPEANGLPAGEALAIVFSEWAADADLSVEKLSMADVIGRLNGTGFWVRHNRASIGAFLYWLDRLPKFALRYGNLRDAIAQVSAIAGARR